MLIHPNSLSKEELIGYLAAKRAHREDNAQGDDPEKVRKDLDCFDARANLISRMPGKAETEVMSILSMAENQGRSLNTWAGIPIAITLASAGFAVSAICREDLYHGCFCGISFVIAGLGSLAIKMREHFLYKGIEVINQESLELADAIERNKYAKQRTRVA